VCRGRLQCLIKATISEKIKPQAIPRQFDPRGSLISIHNELMLSDVINTGAYVHRVKAALRKPAIVLFVYVQYAMLTLISKVNYVTPVAVIMMGFSHRILSTYKQNWTYGSRCHTILIPPYIVCIRCGVAFTFRVCSMKPVLVSHSVRSLLIRMLMLWVNICSSDSQ